MNAQQNTQAIALGTMAMTGCYGAVARADAIATIRAFLDAGQTYVDTADLYADGDNEVLVGEAIRGRRQDVQVCTKVGFTFGLRSDERGLDARPERIEAACDASLKRMGIDHIDLYYLHRVDPKVPVAETVGAMKRLVEKGKVRELGLCEVSRTSLLAAMAVHPISALQCEYSLWSRDPEYDTLAACREYGMRFFGYAPLGRGFLTGQIKTAADIPDGDQRKEYPRFMGENFAKNLVLVEEVRAQAHALSATPAQLAIAWILRTHQAVPIVGATTAAQIEENLQALKLELSDELLQTLERILPAGERYPESAMKRLDPSLRPVAVV
ncbi:aldo/keto reductase [Variovorax sp. J22P271]|uniref:aldo/keto reductase n=1 Tax=Variovorax davisae TaxID=3053515 RepID=UPI002574BF45|nr:aldo/keto reductase [Variovorax sp. J22P271]MDM0032011.1 aldo/keto reductase [Variovorax sp. J22P271]